MNLILLKPGEISGGHARLTGRRFIHVRDVLKSAPGDILRTGVLGGARYAAHVVRITPDSCEIAIGAESDALPVCGVDVLLALPRPKCLKRILPQIAALGVGRLYIAGAEKVEKNYWGSRYLLPDEYQPLLEEGLEQSGGTLPPEIIVSRRLKPLLEDEIAARYADARKIIAHVAAENADAETLPDARRTIIAIGPEGGWTEYELAMFGRLDFTRFAIGLRILRTDTAVVATVARFIR